MDRHYVLHAVDGPIYFRRAAGDVFARLDGSTWSPVEVDLERFLLNPVVEEIPKPPDGGFGVSPHRLDGEPLPAYGSSGRSVRR